MVQVCWLKIPQSFFFLVESQQVSKFCPNCDYDFLFCQFKLLKKINKLQNSTQWHAIDLPTFKLYVFQLYSYTLIYFRGWQLRVWKLFQNYIINVRFEKCCFWRVSLIMISSEYFYLLIFFNCYSYANISPQTFGSSTKDSLRSLNSHVLISKKMFFTVMVLQE